MSKETLMPLLPILIYVHQHLQIVYHFFYALSSLVSLGCGSADASSSSLSLILAVVFAYESLNSSDREENLD